MRDNFCQSTSGKERISKLKSTGPMHMFVINGYFFAHEMGGFLI